MSSSRRNLQAGLYAKQKFDLDSKSEVQKLWDEYKTEFKFRRPEASWFYRYSELSERFPIYWDELKRVKKLIYRAPYRKGRKR